MKRVIVQQWTESELGWGVRPDGCTVHLVEQDKEAFIKAYDKRLREMYGSRVPNEYSFPQGESYVGVISDDLYNKLLRNKRDGEFGFWLTEKDVPKPYEVEPSYSEEFNSES